MSKSVETVIVGAGLAGLTAAWRLKSAGLEDFIVLEAQDRVGGRTYNLPNERTGYIEQGGTWVGPTHTNLLALAHELGIGIRPGRPEGRTLIGNRGEWTDVDFPNDSADPEAQRQFTSALAEFEALSASVDTSAPWQTPNADTLDAMTANDWIELTIEHPDARVWFEGCLRKMQGGDTRDVSMLWMLQFVGSATFKDLMETAEDFRFVGGSHSISTEIAARLGQRVILSQPVASITQQDDGGVVVTSSQAKFRAQHVIVATTPAMAHKIAFDPPLPDNVTARNAEWSHMSWIKFNAIYPTPFWRGVSVGSQFLCMDRLIETFDISPKSEAWGEVVGFLLPDSPGRTSDDREAYCKSFLHDAYGPGGENPETLVFMDWNKNDNIGGCVTALPTGSLSLSTSGLSEPVGRVFWASSERSPIWANYMEGAVTSGRMAADKLLSARVIERAPASAN